MQAGFPVLFFPPVPGRKGSSSQATAFPLPSSRGTEGTAAIQGFGAGELRPVRKDKNPGLLRRSGAPRNDGWQFPGGPVRTRACDPNEHIKKIRGLLRRSDAPRNDGSNSDLSFRASARNPALESALLPRHTPLAQPEFRLRPETW